jgi:hypothetical protein
MTLLLLQAFVWVANLPSFLFLVLALTRSCRTIRARLSAPTVVYIKTTSPAFQLPLS